MTILWPDGRREELTGRTLQVLRFMLAHREALESSSYLKLQLDWSGAKMKAAWTVYVQAAPG